MDAQGMKTGTSSGESGTACARRMALLVREQRDLCVQLESLSVAQSAMVEGGDTDGVLEVLGQRQRVIDRMSHVNEDLAPLRERREELLAVLGQAERHTVQMFISEINELVERVRTRDEQDRDTMERRRAGIAGEITGVTRARGAVAAYSGARTHSGPRFQDRQG